MLVNNCLFKETRIVAVFNIDLIDFKKALGIVAASLHLNFCIIHNHVYLFLPICRRHIYKQKKLGFTTYRVVKVHITQDMQSYQSGQNVI